MQDDFIPYTPSPYLEEIGDTERSIQDAASKLQIEDDDLKAAYDLWYDYKTKYIGLERNELCLCGSGKKYKKCCLPKFRQPFLHVFDYINIAFQNIRKTRGIISYPELRSFLSSVKNKG
jgi:hypothetical protein